MPNKRQKYDEEFKKNVVRLSFASNKTFRETAENLGIEVSMLYRWRKRYTPEGEKTQYATLEEEYRALRIEVAERGCGTRIKNSLGFCMSNGIKTNT